MAIFDELGKKLTNAGQNVVKGTKDLADIARLNSQISDEQKQIAALRSALGELFYESYGARLNELGPDGQQFVETCEEITAAYTRIAQYQDEVQQIKGVKVCTKCGTEVTLNAAFCSSCGAAIERAAAAPAAEPAKKFCVGCGAQMEHSAAFCISCGMKAE